MKRSSTWDKRMLVHATLNSGESQCFALLAENFAIAAVTVRPRNMLESIQKSTGLSKVIRPLSDRIRIQGKLRRFSSVQAPTS